MKHIEIDLYFVREKVISKRLKVNHIPTFYQRADILTKPLSTTNFIRLKEELRVRSDGAEREEGRNPRSD